MATTAQFRTCPDTGFKIHLEADKLIKWNAVTGVVFLLIGGLFGLLVAMTRWPAVHLLPADLFYLALTAHGLDVLLVWIIFFEIAILYFACTVLLGSRLATPKVAWLAYWMMLVGAVGAAYPHHVAIHAAGWGTFREGLWGRSDQCFNLLFRGRLWLLLATTWGDLQNATAT